jgi:hypothetical protein
VVGSDIILIDLTFAIRIDLSDFARLIICSFGCCFISSRSVLHSIRSSSSVWNMGWRSFGTLARNGLEW